MNLNVTHTYVILEVSQQTYNEIRTKLKSARYDHALMDDGEIDMHGIAVKAIPEMVRYYYGGRYVNTSLLPCPYVYHYTSEEEEIQDYLGDPLPTLEDATEAAHQWAEERGLTPLELE